MVADKKPRRHITLHSRQCISTDTRTPPKSFQTLGAFVKRKALLYNLQVMFGYDGAECCSIVYVADVAGEHTNLVAVSGSYAPAMEPSF